METTWMIYKTSYNYLTVALNGLSINCERRSNKQRSRKPIESGSALFERSSVGRGAHPFSPVSALNVVPPSHPSGAATQPSVRSTTPNGTASDL